MPIKEYTSHSPSETWTIAAELARSLPARVVLALRGQLGSGKTCFVQGLANELGVQRAVTSPTFTVINEYRGPRPLYHIDLYRISGPDEVLALGLEEYFESNGITAIEWPERAGDLLPVDTVHIHMQALSSKDERRITIEC